MLSLLPLFHILLGFLPATAIGDLFVRGLIIALVVIFLLIIIAVINNPVSKIDAPYNKYLTWVFVAILVVFLLVSALQIAGFI